jgi:nitrogen fixation protein FixH
MNWGYKILVVIILFVAGMGFMLSIAMKQKNEMIDENYYVKELQYQGQIDAQNNLNALGEDLTLLSTPEGFLLRIPSAAGQDIKEGNIIFLRSSDQSKDRKIALKLDEKGEQLIPQSNFIRGQYSVRISWQSVGKPYYYEETVFAN